MGEFATMRDVARYLRGDEVFEIAQDDKVLEIVEGGVASQRKFVSREHAALQLQKLVDKRLAEGFVLAERAAPPEAVWPSPEDVAALEVHADALMARGDPRGQLIAFQLALEAPDLDERARRDLERRAARLLDDQPEAFFGPLARVASGGLADAPHGAAALSATFRRGSIERARIAASARMPIGRLYRHLIALPLARSLRGLTVGAAVERSIAHEGFHYQELYDAAREAGLPPALEELHLGDVTDRIAAHLNLTDPSPLLGPGLRALRLCGQRLELPPLAHATLQELTLRADSAATHRALRGAALPRLEQLRVEPSGGDHVGLERMFEAVAAAAPALRRLALVGVYLEGDSLEPLLEGGLLARLEELDLSNNAIGEERAELLIDRAPRFAHLVRLVLDKNYLPVALVRRIHEALPCARAYDQSSPPVEDRYGDAWE